MASKARKGPIRAFMQKRRLQKRIGQQLLEAKGVERGIIRDTSDGDIEALKRGGIDEYIAESQREWTRFSKASLRTQTLEKRLQRVNDVNVMSNKAKKGSVQRFVRKMRLRGVIDAQITAEGKKRRKALKKVRTESDIWVRPLFEDRMPNKEETAAKARYDVVNAEFEARNARILDLEKRRARVGRGGYFSGQPKKRQ